MSVCVCDGAQRSYDKSGPDLEVEDDNTEARLTDSDRIAGGGPL